MEINRIKELAQIKKITIKDLAKEVGMSETGFHQAIKKGSLKVITLEKIGETLAVPITAFFLKDEAGNMVSESNQIYARNIKSHNITQSNGDKICQEELQKAEKKIRELQDELLIMMRKKAKG